MTEKRAASDDLGKTWKWSEPELQGVQRHRFQWGLSCECRQLGANVFVSSDSGNRWIGPFATGIDEASLILVGKQFWLAGRRDARASVDGRTWCDLPKGILIGKIIASRKVQ